jgi:hypothetical protein
MGRDKQRSRHFSDYVLQIPMDAIQAMRHKVSASCGNKKVIACVNCLRELYCITVKVQLSSTIHWLQILPLATKSYGMGTHPKIDLISLLLGESAAVWCSELKKKVTTGSGDECVIAAMDQWYITYGEAEGMQISSNLMLKKFLVSLGILMVSLVSLRSYGIRAVSTSGLRASRISSGGECHGLGRPIAQWVGQKTGSNW